MNGFKMMRMMDEGGDTGDGHGDDIWRTGCVLAYSHYIAVQGLRGGAPPDHPPFYPAIQRLTDYSV